MRRPRVHLPNWRTPPARRAWRLALGSRQTPPCRSPARAPLARMVRAPPVATRGETCRARRAPTACRAGPRVARPVSAIRDPATARSTCRHRSPETARLKVSPHEIGQGRIVRSRLVCAQRPIYFLACRQSSLLDCGPFVRLVHRPICHVAARASEPDRAAPARRLKRQAQPQGRAAPGRVRVRP